MTTFLSKSTIAVFGFLACAASLSANDAPELADDPLAADPGYEFAFLNEISGSDANLGGFLFPSLHIFSAFGDSTGEQSDLAVNDHDPQRSATLQGIEPGLSLRAGNLQGFATGAGITNAAGDFSFTFEEGFLKLIDLPLGLELRGGQYLNRFGFQNAVHNHGWYFVDQSLVNGRFLNEGELISQGGEVSWNVPLPMMQASIISASVGGLASHSHGHEEHGHEEHGHEGIEYEAEGAEFTDLLTTATWVNQYDVNDMNRLTGVVSGAWGDNQFGRESQVYGAAFEYLWRENGYGPGGNSVRWRTEAMFRTVDSLSGEIHGGHDEEEEHDDHEEEGHDDHEEHGHEEHDHDEHDDYDEEEHHDEHIDRATFDEFGFSTMLIYGINDRLYAGLRGDWVSGIEEFGLDSRWRVSPNLTWYANRHRTVQTRLQYNYDHSDDFGSESSVWFQIGLSWGGGEVR